MIRNIITDPQHALICCNLDISLVCTNFKVKTLFSIKSFGQLLIWSKLGGESLYLRQTCGQNSSNIRFPSFLWMFAGFQILQQQPLFCVFVPFVFKLWLSGSILHLSSNLLPLTPSYHLQTCGTQKVKMVLIDSKGTIDKLEDGGVSSERIWSPKNREKKEE